MKKFTLLMAACLMAGALWSQTPVNDDCPGIIEFGQAPVCLPDTFTNVGATPSLIAPVDTVSCFNSAIAHRDVWFSFICPDTLFDFRITLTGVGANSIVNPEFAVYRGDCAFGDMEELLCARAAIGETSLILDITGLTPGLPYFIRVSDYSVNATPNSGDFTLCVTAIPPITNVDDGSSSLCEGTLYDTGGPDEDYGSDEDHTFVICPSTPAACITFTMPYFNIENGGFGFGDVLSFYDGDGTDGTLLAQLGGGGFGPPNGAAGGGVCFQVQATSGCLTVHFVSDGITELEGWEGNWTCSTEACPPLQELNVNTDITPDTIVAAVSTPATTVTITNISCPTGAYGTFSFPTDNNDVGLQKGLLLTSGQADLAIGPNVLTGVTGINEGGGDPDLDYLSQQQGNGSLSQDACIVELDVFVASDELTFEYVFGSDEYPEYVNSNFNDIFAFLISGPGIAGDPNLGNANNIAVVPGTTTPVQINSVNNLLNWQYYRNNQAGQVLEYDGLTSDSMGVKKSLTARQAVIPCNTYHLKLAVSDRGDQAFDSGVFISEIKGGTQDIDVEFASGIDYFIEDCTGSQDQLVIKLSQPAPEAVSYVITVSGTATLGVDYTLNIPPVISFQPGDQILTFPIVPIADNINEGTETIVIQLSNNFGCGTVVYETLTIELKDNVEVEVNGGDTLFVCQGSTLQLQATGAVSYTWSPPSAGFSNPFSANPSISPTQDQWLVVTGSIATCVDIDSVFVKIISPVVSVEADGATAICQGSSVQLIANNNVNGQGLTWTPAAGLNNPTSATPIATPLATTTYKATINLAGCMVSDQITITVDTLFFPTLTTTDTTVCQNYPVQLANVLNTTTTYEWTPAAGLDDPSSSGPIALADATTTYTLLATSSNEACTQTASVTVNILAADVDISGDPYRELCLGQTAELTAQGLPGGGPINWTPTFYVSNPTGTVTTANPDETVTIVATYTINGCLVRDSVQLRVDSLPDQSLRREEDKAVYCPGDTVYLISPTYEPANFPDLTVHWIPLGTQITPDSNWNMVIIADSTRFYERVVTNRACSDTSGIEVPVAFPPVVMATVSPQQICLGQTVQINVTVDPPDTKLMWQPSPDLSCTECPNPSATPSSSGVVMYNVTTPEADCPGGASVSVDVLAPPQLGLSDLSICLGDEVTLNSIDDPTATYNWTSDPPGFSSTQSMPVLTPQQTTTYFVTAQGPACSSSGQLTVTVSSATLAAGPDQTICFGEAATLSASTTGTPGQVVWGPGGFTENTITVSPTETTEYTAILNFGNGCSVSDQVTVNVIGNLNVELTGEPSSSETVCPNEPIAFTASAPGAISYVWSVNGMVRPGLTGESAVIMLETAEGTAVVEVVATDANGCTNSDTMVYQIGSLDLTLNALPDADSICAGETVTLRVTDADAVSYVWSENGTVLAGQSADTALIAPTTGPGGTAVLQVVATDALGCTGTESVSYVVKECIEIPNAFTPGGDGFNDTFGPVFLGGEEQIVEFVIYNRWGLKVFEAKNSADRWNGTFEGKDAPSEVYVYYIRIAGREEPLQGDVTLLR